MTEFEIKQDILSKLTPRMIIQGAIKGEEKPMGFLLTYIKDMYGLSKTQGWNIAEAVLAHYNIKNKMYNKIFENKNLKKQTIKLNESQLRRMIQEAINELDPRTMASYAQKRQAQANGEMPLSQSQERRGMNQQQIQQQAQQGRQGAVDAWNRDFGWENQMEYGDYDNPNDKDYGKEYYRMGLSNDGTQYSTHWKQDLSNGGGVASKSSYFPNQSGGTEYYRARNGYEGNRQVDAKQLDGGDKVAYQMQTGTGKYNKKTGKWVNEYQLRNIIRESLKKIITEAAFSPNYPANTIENTIWNNYNLPWNKVDDTPEQYQGIWYITVDFFDYTEHMGSVEIDRQFKTLDDCLNYAQNFSLYDAEELCNEEVTDEGFSSISLNIMCQCENGNYEVANTKMYLPKD